MTKTLLTLACTCLSALPSLSAQDVKAHYQTLPPIFNSDRSMYFQFATPDNDKDCSCYNRERLYRQQPCRLAVYKTSSKKIVRAFAIDETSFNTATTCRGIQWHYVTGWLDKSNLSSWGDFNGAADDRSSLEAINVFDGIGRTVYSTFEYVVWGKANLYCVSYPEITYRFEHDKTDHSLRLFRFKTDPKGGDLQIPPANSKLWELKGNQPAPKISPYPLFSFLVGNREFAVKNRQAPVIEIKAP